VGEKTFTPLERRGAACTETVVDSRVGWKVRGSSNTVTEAIEAAWSRCAGISYSCDLFSALETLPTGVLFSSEQVRRLQPSAPPIKTQKTSEHRANSSFLGSFLICSQPLSHHTPLQDLHEHQGSPSDPMEHLAGHLCTCAWSLCSPRVLADHCVTTTSSGVGGITFRPWAGHLTIQLILSITLA